MTGLVKYDEAQGLSWAAVKSMAATLAKARGFVPREMLEKPHEIAAAILTGQELGIGPMQSLRSIYVIDGRPMLSADLMLSMAIRAGVRHQWLESTSQVARLRLSREGFEPHEHAFTIAEAKAAGLDRRQNWQRYAPAMLRARCLSAAMRAFCPDVLGGGVYVEGEIEPDEQPPEPPRRERTDAPPDLEAQVIDAEAEPARPQPTPKMSDCATAEELHAWCERYGAAVRKHCRESAVVEHGETIGVGAADVMRWLGAEAA